MFGIIYAIIIQVFAIRSYLVKGGAGMSGMRENIFRRLRLYIGIVLAFGLISYLSFDRGIPILIAPLAASACILFAVPHSHFARPKNVILGHVLSSAIGVFVHAAFGVDWFSNALCVALAVAAMDLTDTMHPPAAATSLLALTTSQGYRFIFTPVALGACMLVLVSEFVKFTLRDSTYDR